MKKSPKVKKSPSYRFTLGDRARIKEDIRGHLSRFKGLEGHVAGISYCPTVYLRGDWTITDEVVGNGNHVLFPLRVDKDLRLVKTALRLFFRDVFRDDAVALRDSIYTTIKRLKAEERKWDRGKARFTDHENMLGAAPAFFGPGYLSGTTLLTILTPDDKSKARWKKNLRGSKIESFRVPSDTAARVVSDLLNEEFDVTMTPAAIKKRFQKKPRP